MFLLILGILLEVASRWILLPYLKQTSTRSQKSPQKEKIDISRYNLIAIGDSFVQTGADGWIRFLEMKGWKVLNLGSGGACPSMYLQTFKEIEPQLKKNQTVLMLLYIGNDFTDESVWESLKNKEQYRPTRDKLYFRSNYVYWPYAETDLEKRRYWQSLKKRSAFLKVLGILKYSIYLRLQKQPETPPPSTMDRYMQVYKITDLERQNHLLEEILEENISQKQNVFKTNGRTFFVRHHNATAFDVSEANKAAAMHILEMVGSLKNSRNVFIVPLLDREEIGISFHHQPTRKNASFVEQLKKVNPNVIDINPAFENEFPKKNLYLVDGHWNPEGHKLFAASLAEAFWDKF